MTEPPVILERQPRSRGRAIFKPLLELLLISVGVFLGLAGDQWRENADHRASAQIALRQFRSEIIANRTAVSNVAEYHAMALKNLRAYLAKDRRSRNAAEVHLQGIRPVFFAHTAWDLSLATHSLAYVEPHLAYELSQIYNAQEAYADLTRGVTQAMYVVSPRDNFDGFAGAIEVYYSDVVITEPRLLTMYATVLPRLDSALGSAPTAGKTK